MIAKFVLPSGWDKVWKLSGYDLYINCWTIVMVESGVCMLCDMMELGGI